LKACVCHRTTTIVNEVGTARYGSGVDILICQQPSLAIPRWPEIRMHLEKSGQQRVTVFLH